MPRTSDHDARRRQIADAVSRVIVEAGLDAATVSRVAAEAGISVGLVQHYFHSKDELLLFAYQQVVTEMGARVTARITKGEEDRQTISAVVHASLLELLPLDSRRRNEYRVTRTFLGRSVDNPALAAVARATSDDIRAQLATAVNNGKECGEVGAATDGELAALRISAIADGLAEQLYFGADRAVGSRTVRSAADHILRAALDEVFSGECRHYR